MNLQVISNNTVPSLCLVDQRSTSYPAPAVTIHPWFNYIIFEKKCKTYIGSTVNISRRIRQHNCEIKGGAKYTRGGKWSFYCVLYDLLHTKNTSLSYEWHLKHSCKTKKINPKNRRKIAIEKFLSNKKHRHILFISLDHKNITPIVPMSILIIYLKPEEFTSDIINNKILAIKNILKYFKYKL